MEPLIECVPNFSEGRNMSIIQTITREIDRIEGVTLLHVDPGASANRTVVTFIGHPEPIAQAAFASIQTAVRLIDMRDHQGEHPRIGAVDVFPLVPYAGISMEETVVIARQLAQRVGDELHLPVYCYANAAFQPTRINLASIRAGEYEGLVDKMENPFWAPDFGPHAFNPKSGATVIGARDILVAFNINLDTPSARIAHEIACAIRESGRFQRHPVSGQIIRNADGNAIQIPGTLKKVKAIGWYIPEYGCSQVSMNLIDIKTTPMHIAFDEVRTQAQQRGVQVTGSELIGMVPLQALREAGMHAVDQHANAQQMAESTLVDAAIDYLGLDNLAPFDPRVRIIEYALCN
ncbi:MAG: glutamate formimidoyltransferase [Anaerolineae bacterium]|nr:glutamate formimidoyltransferase [Anaerolineae bacterium]